MIITLIIYSPLLHANYTISATKNAIINAQLKTITLNENVQIKNDAFTFNSQNAMINYVNFQNVGKNLKAENFMNFTRIAANGNVSVIMGNSIINADSYVYDILQKAMVLKSNTSNPVTYSGEKMKLTATKQFEYQEQDNILVARGRPKLILHNNKNTNNKDTKNKQAPHYTLVSNLISAKLNNEKNDIIFLQAFDKLVLTSDNYIITGDYGVFDKNTNIIVIQDNINLSDGKSDLSGCKIIIDLNTEQTKLIPCDLDKGFQSEIKKDKYK